MLTHMLLKNHAGVLLCGDYLTLRALHDTLHECNEKSVMVRDKEGWLLALAYDVRKAYELQRRVLEPPEHYPEIGQRFGVEILWPVVLVQCRMFRASLGYFNSAKKHQSLAYALEAMLEDALDDDFGPRAAQIKEHWAQVDPSHPFAEEKLRSRGCQFSAWGKAERKRNLAGLMMSLQPMYAMMYSHAVRNGRSDLLDPAELDVWEDREWPKSR